VADAISASDRGVQQAVGGRGGRATSAPPLQLEDPNAEGLFQFVGAGPGVPGARSAERMTTMTLFDTWRRWAPSSPPYVLDDDRSASAITRSVLHTSWESAHRSDDFASGGDSRLHLGLLPVPFIGNLATADIVVLLLNPGLSAGDYFGEYEVPAFRQALLDNLRQVGNDDHPFFYLNPAYGWHSGFQWWNNKLSGVIELAAKHWSESFADARHRTANRLAAIQLVPYHSATFSASAAPPSRLPSAKLARDYVHSELVPRALGGDVTIIVARQAATWGLPTSENIVTYSQRDARGAHLTPGSPGGAAILERLLR